MKFYRITAMIIALAVMVGFSGCDFVDAFTKGFQEGLNGSSTAEKPQVGIDGPFYKALKDKNMTKQQKLDALSAQIEAGDLYLQDVAAIKRFGIEHEIDLPANSKSDKINKLLQDFSCESFDSDKIIGVRESYEIFGGKYYEDANEDNVYTFYFGDVKNNRPNGYGVLFNVYRFSFNSTGHDELRILDYVGQFANGRREGYGIQYYPPTEFQMDEISSLASKYMEEKYGIYAPDIHQNYTEDNSECSCEWCIEIRKVVSIIFDDYLNIVEYEGDFKGNQYNGKGVMDLEYTNAFHELGEEYQIEDLRGCYKRLCSGDNGCSILFVGDFKDGWIDENCKQYSRYD